MREMCGEQMWILIALVIIDVLNVDAQRERDDPLVRDSTNQTSHDETTVLGLTDEIRQGNETGINITNFAGSNDTIVLDNHSGKLNDATTKASVTDMPTNDVAVTFITLVKEKQDTTTSSVTNKPTIDVASTLNTLGKEKQDTTTSSVTDKPTIDVASTLNIIGIEKQDTTTSSVTNKPTIDVASTLNTLGKEKQDTTTSSVTDKPTIDVASTVNIIGKEKQDTTTSSVTDKPTIDVASTLNILGKEKQDTTTSSVTDKPTIDVASTVNIIGKEKQDTTTSSVTDKPTIDVASTVNTLGIKKQDATTSSVTDKPTIDVASTVNIIGKEKQDTTTSSVTDKPTIDVASTVNIIGKEKQDTTTSSVTDKPTIDVASTLNIIGIEKQDTTTSSVTNKPTIDVASTLNILGKEKQDTTTSSVTNKPTIDVASTLNTLGKEKQDATTSSVTNKPTIDVASTLNTLGKEKQDTTTSSVTDKVTLGTTPLINIDVDNYWDVEWDYVLRDYMTCADINHDNITINMVTTTDQSKLSTHKKCLVTSKSDVYDRIPVYSNAVHIHFKNMYCSAFVMFHEYYVNGPEIYSTLTYWHMTVNLDCYLDLANSVQRYAPYDLFLLKLMTMSKSDCDFKFSPPGEIKTPIGFAEVPGCSLSIANMCTDIRLMKANETDLKQKLCSLCMWLYHEDACVYSLYIQYADLLTYIKLQPPSDLFSSTVSKDCIDQTWMPNSDKQSKIVCFEPIESVSGLIADFWVKLIIWDNEDTDVSDIFIALSVKHVLGIDDDLEIRLVDISEFSDKAELDDGYKELEVKGRLLRCKSMYIVVWSKKYVPLLEVKSFVSMIRAIFSSSTRFVLGEGIELYLSLYEPSCFTTEPQRATTKQLDENGELDTIHKAIALSIGLSMPIIIFLAGACLSVKQYCTIQWVEET